jgi:hypothetical protein
MFCGVMTLPWLLALALFAFEASDVDSTEAASPWPDFAELEADALADALTVASPDAVWSP